MNNIRRAFPTIFKLFGKKQKPPTRRASYIRSTTPSRPHKPLNGLDEDGGLDAYELYKLDQLGADIPATYTNNWEND